MRLVVENFAKIKHADLEFDGITVLAGKNNTGKSTIGKILFALFHSLYKIKNKTLFERKSEIGDTILNSLEEKREIKRNIYFFWERIGEIISDSKVNTKEIFLKKIRTTLQEETGVNLLEEKVAEEKIQKKVDEIWAIPDGEIEKKFTEERFQNIFSNQMNSLLCQDVEAKARLTIQQQDVILGFRQNECTQFIRDAEIMNRAIYVDNPFLIDDVEEGGDSFSLPIGAKNTIQQRCIGYLKRNRPQTIVSKLLAEEKLSKVYDMLQSVIPGKLVMRENNRGLFLQQPGFAEEINVRNLSAGMKSFAILKRLLENGSLQERDVLILDEPEIHLHPQWQMCYAELIVLLQKTFELTILLTTHSPFFLDAIEVFSAKHTISDRLHYYLSKQEGSSVVFEDVTNHIDRIYEQMSEPVQFLENMRNEISMGR